MQFRETLTYSNVMSTVAVFLALAGGSYAVANVGKSDVGAREVENDSLKSKELRDGKAVKSADIVDDQIASVDVEDGSLASVDVEDGSLLADDISLSTLPSDPEAYASVIGPTTNVSVGKNITDDDVVKRDVGAGAIDGQYCVSTSAQGIVSVNVSSASTVSTPETDRIASVTNSLGALGGCPAGAEAFVRIWDVSAAAFVDDNFHIWMTD